MHIVFSARGSRGDVYPVLAAAKELVSRGHTGVVCVPRFFAPMVHKLGLRCVEYDEDTDTVMRGFGSGWRAARTALRWLAYSIEEEFDILLEETRHADAVITTGAEIPPATIAQHRGIPHLRFCYAPVLPGDQPPPLQPFQRLPALANRALWVLLNASIKLLFGTQLNRWRARLGLPLVDELGIHLAGSSHTFLAISPHLAPPSPLWAGRPYRYTYLGYSFEDEPARLPDEVQGFLEEGPPPVYVGFGSVHLAKSHKVASALVDAVVRSGCRVLLGRGWTGLGDGLALPPQMLAVGELPHHLLFPWVAGCIHHGGSGTVHNVARFGVPQVAMPQIADQFYWAHRLFTLGLGPAPLRADRLTSASLAEALRALADEQRYRRNARALADRMAGEPGIAGAANVVEKVVGVPAQSSSSLAVGPV